jgi:anaerobic dimethyl sulfoxide reductase subunit A
MIQTLPTFCGKDCGGDACPLLATIENGRVTRVVNNPAGGKYLKGCTRGFGLPLETYAPDRILHPLMRVGARGSGQFRRASWDEALDFTAQKLQDIHARYGPTAVMNANSAGSLGALHATWALLARFLSLYGGYTDLTGGYSNAAACFVLPYLLGADWTRSGFDTSMMQYADMIILWGANLLETRQGVDVPQRLVEARKRGAQIVVIDPRRTATVKHAASWWLPCRPGTDAALMLAVLHVLLSENLADRDFIQSHSSGFDQLEAYILGMDGAARSAQWAETICGIPAEEIVRFARAYAAAKPAMLFPGYSIQRVFAGEETYRLTVALQIATGNFGVLGGSTGSMNNLLPHIRVGQLPVPPCSDIPAVRSTSWPDAVLEGRAGGYPSDIHAIYIMGSNLLNQGAEIKKSIAAFENVDFVVSHELFMTPSARWSDVVFPAASALEVEDIGIPWHGYYLAYKPQVVHPRGEARSDYDALCDLSARMGFGEQFSQGRTASDWIDQFILDSEIPDAEEFRRIGIYYPADPERPGLADFSANPLRFPLDTPSGKVEIASQRYQRETGFPAIPTWQEPPQSKRYPLLLITPKSPYRTHSQGSSIAEIRQRKEHTLEIHPQDASQRGISQGARVYLYNQQGLAEVVVQITDDLTPGVVCLLEGIWVDLDDQGIDRSGSANMLTSTAGTQPGRAPVMHAIHVEVTKNLDVPHLQYSNPS